MYSLLAWTLLFLIFSFLLHAVISVEALSAETPSSILSGAWPLLSIPVLKELKLENSQLDFLVISAGKASS